MQKQPDISGFYVIGINYKKTDAAIRGLFAINNDQYRLILQSAAASFGVQEFFILSTCNRTEIYGFADDEHQLINVVCSLVPSVQKELFSKLTYRKNGLSAIRHLFKVGAGLDSQILGDYEIVGQIKQSIKLAKLHINIGPFLERLVNAVLQSSKIIKNSTALSGGTVSVSFAAVQYIRNNLQANLKSNILLIGTGKIGRNTCKNLIDYYSASNITLINRTENKAASLAAELNLTYKPLEYLAEEIDKADIILVATNAPEPIVLKKHLENKGKKIVIDLSIPYNVAIDAKSLSNVTVVNVDQLSQLKDETLKKREEEVPKAKTILSDQINEFLDWFEMRKHVTVLKAVKNKLQDMQTCKLFNEYATQQTSSEFIPSNTEQKIQKVINVMALKMRNRNERGCQYIQAINDYIACGAN